MEIEDNLLSGLEQRIVQNTDVAKAMEEFFKDDIDLTNSHHSIDLRSRLISRSIQGHSIINFLSSIKIKETKGNLSLAEGLDILSISLKRHSLSHEGKSRAEIINLFQAQTEKQKSNFNIFQPTGIK